MNRLLPLLIIMLCGFATLQAQDNLILNDAKFPTGGIDEQVEFIKNTIPTTNRDEITFKLRFFNKSNYSKHYTFDVMFEQLPIYGSFIKVNTDKSNNILSSAKGIGNLLDYSSEQINWERGLWAKKEAVIDHWPNNEIVKETSLTIYESDHQASVVQLQKAWGTTYDKTKLVSLDNQLIGEWNHVRKLGIDTFINANVFDPDPLTSLSKMYGMPFVDSNDQDLPWFSTAYIPVNIPAVYDTVINKFFIENNYVKMVDLQPPNNPPAESVNNNFYYDRSNPHFEEGMAAYHITQFHNQIDALGYGTLMDVQLEVDVHGGTGDNSVFHRNTGGAPYILFGDGGVDDAEDADVIIHEYCHGISWSANGNNHITSERIAIDEGIADYFATSYSRNISSYRWQDMFTWDGHNEYWGGRSANTTNDYFSSPLNIYGLGEVFNTAMQNIYTDIGKNATDELMLEALYSFTDSTNLPSAAYYVLQADNLINGGANRWTICNHFKSKNLLSWDCYPTSTANVDQQTLFNVKNSIGFSQGTGDLIIEFGKHKNVNIQLFDINGRQLFRKKQTSTSFTLNPNDYVSGIYFLKLQNENGTQTVKLSR